MGDITNKIEIKINAQTINKYTLSYGCPNEPDAGFTDELRLSHTERLNHNKNWLRGGLKKSTVFP
jgi:hypothetical protein